MLRKSSGRCILCVKLARLRPIEVSTRWSSSGQQCCASAAERLQVVSDESADVSLPVLAFGCYSHPSELNFAINVLCHDYVRA